MTKRRGRACKLGIDSTAARLDVQVDSSAHAEQNPSEDLRERISTCLSIGEHPLDLDRLQRMLREGAEQNGMSCCSFAYGTFMP